METNHVKMDISTAENQNELIRMLAMLRLRSDIAASSKGITEHSVLDFSDEKLASLPERLILHIVSDYFIMRENGVKDKDIFYRLDIQRHLEGHAKSYTRSKTLNAYIKQRIHIEFPQLSSLEDKVIEMEILYTIYWFTKSRRSSHDWEKADSFANRVISSIHQKHEKELEKQYEKPIEAFEVSSKKHTLLIVVFLIVVALGVVAYWLFYHGGFTLLNS